jgi:VIT1/CCC1 family predicted Fe2+/Mn2+ transporter
MDRELRETVELPEREREEVAAVFRGYGLTTEQSAPVIDAICSNQRRWVDFMMRFELGLEEPDPARAGWSAATIAASYIVGGLVPLAPYMLLHDVQTALASSICVTVLALFIFGYVKGRLTTTAPWRGAAQTVFVGGLAAAAAFFIARLIQ